MKTEMELWIARDKDGTLVLYENRPVKYDESFVDENTKQGMLSELPRYYYPQVTFENSPMEVELKLKEGNG